MKVKMSNLSVILYHYDASPFATKVKNMLTLKRIPHKRVNVTSILPRPALADVLGVKYRRIPVLAIGNDVYCDSSIIASVLERRFPPSKGYGTLFPARKGGGGSDIGVSKAIAMFWTDRAMFPLAADCLPYDKFEEKFVKDRSSWLGGPLDIQGMKARQPIRKSALASHLTLLEEQLTDGREWLLDTETPGFADISAHFVLAWARRFRVLHDLFDGKTFPSSVAWIARASAYLDTLQKENVSPFEDITGEEAGELICSGAPRDVVGFVEADAGLVGVKLGDVVSITPSDNGKVPTIGELVALNREEVVVETQGSAGRVAVHFPRLNFSVGTASTVSAKL